MKLEIMELFKEFKRRIFLVVNWLDSVYFVLLRNLGILYESWLCKK